MKYKIKLSKVINKLPSNIQESIKKATEKADIEFEDLEVYRKSITEETKLEEGSRSAILYVSTRTVDAVGDVVIPKGVQLNNYIKNGSPVFFNHDYSKPPIGSDEWIKADDYGIKAKTTFADTGPGTLADIMWKLVQQGHQKQSSVGIIPLEYITKDDNGFKETIKELKDKWPEFKKNAKNCSRIIKKSILFEHSLVSLACNEDTTVESVSKMYKEAGADEKLLKQLGFELKEPSEPVDTEELTENKDKDKTKDTKETFNCSCIDCGHKLTSESHCKDIKCPECGGTMRRQERPGPGEPTKSKDPKKSKEVEEDPKEPVEIEETIKFIKEPEIIKVLHKPKVSNKFIDEAVAKEFRRLKGNIL